VGSVSLLPFFLCFTVFHLFEFLFKTSISKNESKIFASIAHQRSSVASGGVTFYPIFVSNKKKAREQKGKKRKEIRKRRKWNEGALSWNNRMALNNRKRHSCLSIHLPACVCSHLRTHISLSLSLSLSCCLVPFHSHGLLKRSVMQLSE